MNNFVYVLRLATGKHFYIGSTGQLIRRMLSHMRISANGLRKLSLLTGGARATRVYGFTGDQQDILLLVPCANRDDAYRLEWDLACKYRQLFPDVCICSDSYSFGTYNTDQLE